ncbi:Uncharacterised protein [uncultured archaeon]|nr:Uncharacterised protein [uncultured archaeon]
MRDKRKWYQSGLLAPKVWYLHPKSLPERAVQVQSRLPHKVYNSLNLHLLHFLCLRTFLALYYLEADLVSLIDSDTGL